MGSNEPNGNDTEAHSYRVALTLCNVVLSRCRNEDVLIFHSILEAPLPVLRRRGYNVDRILNQQKTERLARIADMEQAKERERLALEEASQQDMVAGADSKTGRPRSSISEKSTAGSSDSKPADEVSLRSSGIMNQLKARFKQQQQSQTAQTTTSTAIPTPTPTPLPVGNSNEVRSCRGFSLGLRS
jgi:hypothetical protein